MEERKVNFFEKMKTAEHRGFEISMFAVSILMAVVVLISIVMLGIYWGKGSSNTVSDDGADDMATSSAVTVDNDEDSAVATQPPENPIISEDDFGSSDEDLKAGEFAYTTAYVNMRSEASLSASVVTKVPSGTKLKLNWKKKSGLRWIIIARRDISIPCIYPRRSRLLLRRRPLPPLPGRQSGQRKRRSRPSNRRRNRRRSRRRNRQ